MNIDYIKNRIKNKDDMPLIEKAFNFANLKLSGLYYSVDETLINHILGIVNTLIDFNADTSTLISCLLYESIKNGVSKEEIEREFGLDISNIAFTTSIINVDNLIQNDENQKRYLEQLNVDVPEDVRTLFIKLADRLYSMKTAKTSDSEYQKRVARETLEILVPTAQRFRLNYIKSRLEDLCLSYLDPQTYNEILSKLNATPEILSIQLNETKKDISNLLSNNGINFVIKGRVKNIYSIYNKLISGKSWDEIYDILALRIILDDESECSKIAELIHSNYMYLSERFKDYINNPKENMYQSLHTTIIHNNRFYEIQIRTNEMHRIAEVGNASHQLYKQKTLRNMKI